MIDASVGAGCPAQYAVNSVMVKIVDVVLVAVVIKMLIDDGYGTGSFAAEANGEEGDE